VDLNVTIFVNCKLISLAKKVKQLKVSSYLPIVARLSWLKKYANWPGKTGINAMVRERNW